MSNAVAIEVHGLHKTYRGIRGRHQVLAGVDLQVGTGEVVGLIGANGAGKTTLMSCLLRFLRPTAGEIRIDGRVPDDLEIRRRSGFVPERVGFEKGLTGEELLFWLGRLSGLQDLRSRIDELLERFQLGAARRKKLSTYSRGMLQRIAMCQAILHCPDFLFLDEPTSGLDPGGIMLFREVLQEERSRGATIVLNSHQLSEVERVCDRILFLREGRIVADESLARGDELRLALRFLATPDAAARLERMGFSIEENLAFRSVENEAAIPGLLRRLLEEEIQVVEVTRRGAELERYFKEVVP